MDKFYQVYDIMSSIIYVFNELLKSFLIHLKLSLISFTNHLTFIL